MGASGTISTALRQYLSNRPGKHGIKELQENSHIGHCTQTAGSVSVKVKVKQSNYRPEVPRGFQEVKFPRLSDNGPGWW